MNSAFSPLKKLNYIKLIKIYIKIYFHELLERFENELEIGEILDGLE